MTTPAHVPYTLEQSEDDLSDLRGQAALMDEAIVGELGLRLMTGGGTIGSDEINGADAEGYSGLYLDPRFVWHMGGAVFNGIQNFVIESRMTGSIGWNGGVVVPAGYIDTGTGTDGIQVYASTPAGATATQGIIFKNCVLQGSNSRAVIHFGGGQRRCGLVDTLVNNTASASTTVAAGSNGVAVSTFAGAQTLNVASAASFPTSGTLIAATSTTAAIISYTNTTGTTFTGCSLIAGTGNLATGGSVTQAAFGVAVDSGLSDNNSEDMIFSFTGGGGIASASTALGIGVYDQTQHANDTGWYELATHAGTYSVVHTGGGNHLFTNYYDRSNPSGATIWQHGGSRMTFMSGEHQNNTGQSHLVDGTGQTVLIACSLTQAGGQTTTVQATNGSFIMRGPCQTNSAQTWSVSGSAVIDVADPAIAASNATVSGSAGTLLLAGNYAGQGTPPVLTSWTGPTFYQGTTSVASKSLSAQTTAQTLTFTPQLQGIRFRASVWIAVTVAGTSTVASVQFTRRGGVGFGPTNLPFTKVDGNAAVTSTGSITTTGTYVSQFFGETDASGTAISVVITPTGSTFTYSIDIEQVT